ncbi:transporter [candidate division KSB1 bacterium]|nr:transporter [candidate division KSB1 bacterium]
MRIFCKQAVVLAGLLLLVSTVLTAQDVQPRVYAPAPIGVNLLTLGYAYSSGSVLFDKTVPVDNATGNIHSLNAAYSRSIALFGVAGRADVAVPFVTGEWQGDVAKSEQSTSRSGIGDPVIRYALFISGAPALSREKFAGFQPKTIVGVTMRLQVPLGQYDPNKIINLGSNRWVFSPQIGLWHVMRKFTLEAYAGVWLFQDNREFLGTQVKAQKPLFTFQVHVSYLFDNGIWIAVSSRQSLGGAVTIDGGDKLDPETNNRLGLACSIPVKPRYVLKLVATTGVAATVGNDYSTAAVVGQVVF